MKAINSTLYSLSKNDALKAFWLFLSTTVLGLVGDAIMQQVKLGHYSLVDIHWQELGSAILLSVIGYLKVKFLTNSNGDILTKEEKVN